MGLYTKLPDNLQDVDIVLAGGEEPTSSNITNVYNVDSFLKADALAASLLVDFPMPTQDYPY